MHADELEIDADLVRALIAAQFPALSSLPIRPLETEGTENAIFRLGRDLAIRLPRVANASRQAERESLWLPKLAPYLKSLAVPEPICLGQPTAAFPHPWAICRWLDGENAWLEPPRDLRQAARQLARFLTELRSAPVAGNTSVLARRSGRGVALVYSDAATRAAIAECEGLADTETLSAIWDNALATPVWQGAPVWLHGDLHVGNLLTTNGALSGVIDWGSFGMGDPAADLTVAWSMLDADCRAIFRAELDVDDDSWIRGRAWAISVAVIALPYYIETNPLLIALSRHSIEEAVADFKKGR
jgi:aminoglycoside phosphotransferase (APT) family kinase protein